MQQHGSKYFARNPPLPWGQIQPFQNMVGYGSVSSDDSIMLKKNYEILESKQCRG